MSQLNYQPLFELLDHAEKHVWRQAIADRLDSAFSAQAHGDWRRWQEAIDRLPDVLPSRIDLMDGVRIGRKQDLSGQEYQQLENALRVLHPWRKGPYELFGVKVDSEWRSDWKWSRLAGQISPLKNRLVLDVGCGNGYHCWRIFGAGARMVVGIDPTLLSVMQFQAIRKLHGEAPVYVLPIGIDDVPPQLKLFDTVFSMGVLYHRRSPIDHLLELKGCLRSGGELVLETLVIEGDNDQVMVPEGRYAQMRNVWFLPSCQALMLWMRRCGYKNIKLCHVAKTSLDEQRSTDWMRFNSLKDFLNPDDLSLTCEGYPAPIRAIFVATVE